MGSIKQNTRVSCDVKCIMNFEGFDYHGMIENISISGALIKLKNETPKNIHPGDMCGLMLCDNPDHCPIKYTCKVTRFDSEIIGVRFFGLNIN